MKFELEGLESRTLRSVTVEEGYPGFFYVTGDANDNNIDIAVSMQNHTAVIKVNNVALPTYYDVAYVSVEAGDGDDTVTIHSTDGGGDIGGGIRGNQGNDTLDLFIAGAVWGDEGNDTLTLKDSVYGQVLGGDGSDEIFVDGTNPDADIEGGPGNDYIDATKSAMSVRLFGDEGSDMLYGSQYNDQIYGGSGRDTMIGAAGNDEFFADDQESDTLVGGDGYDYCFCESIDVMPLWDIEEVR